MSWSLILILISTIRVYNTDSGLKIRVFGKDKHIVPIALPAEGNSPHLSSTDDVTLKWRQIMKFRDMNIGLLDIRPSKPQDTSEIFVEYGLVPHENLQVFSHSFLSFYRSIPGGEKVFSGSALRGGYLIIAPEQFVSTLQPLKEWLSDQGFTVWIASLTETGYTTSDIKSFIQNAYDTWTPKPEFVLLASDVDITAGQGIPAFIYGLDPTDLPYALLDGNDYLPDIWIGRIPVDNTFELGIVIEKILGYEKTPYFGDTLWYKRALFVGSTHYAYTTKLTKLTIRDRMLDFGYVDVDTLFWYTTGPQPGPQDVINLINPGVGIINYRGWSGPSGWHEPEFRVLDIDLLQNGRMLPVLYNITCAAGDFASSIDPAFGEKWLRAGTPDNLKGGVAFFGPTNPSVHTRWNNAIDVGIFQGLLAENINTLAPSGVRGLFQLFYDFPDRASPGDSIEFYFHVYNTLGLPSTNVYTNVPRQIVADLPQEVSQRGQMIRIHVENQNPQNLYVGITAPDHSLIGHGPVGADGDFYFELPELDVDSIRIVMTGNNHAPLIQMVPVIQEDFPIRTLGFEYDNGVPHPNDFGSITLTVKNEADTSIGPIALFVNSPDTLIHFSDTVFVISVLQPGESVYAGFDVTFSRWLPDRHTIRVFGRVIVGNHQEEHVLILESQAPELKVVGYDAQPGITPGEQTTINLQIKNIGSVGTGGDSVKIILKSWFDGINIIDSVGFMQTLGPGETGFTGADFVLSVNDDVSEGRDIWTKMTWTALTGASLYGAKGMYFFYIGTGEPSPDDPIGPDDYGYWAYDDIDTASGLNPDFNWIELNPNAGGNGNPLYLGDDSTVVLNLPFTFTYYGQQFDLVSVCSNGWISFDSTWYFSFRNWPIPSPHGPENLVAVFWDDLTVEDGAVYYWFDSQNHKFVVEWDAKSRFENQPVEKFELILFDPAYYPTPTGDGMILFQYQDITLVNSGHYGATIGIEDQWHTTGIQILYGDYLSPRAETIESGRAILFSTYPPDTYMTEIEEQNSLVSPVLSVPSLLYESPMVVTMFTPKNMFVTLSIVDVAGRVHQTRRFYLREGRNLIELSTRGITSGKYFLISRFPKKTVIRPVILIR